MLLQISVLSGAWHTVIWHAFSFLNSQGELKFTTIHLIPWVNSVCSTSILYVSCDAQEVRHIDAIPSRNTMIFFGIIFYE